MAEFVEKPEPTVTFTVTMPEDTAWSVYDRIKSGAPIVSGREILMTTIFAALPRPIEVGCFVRLNREGAAVWAQRMEVILIRDDTVYVIDAVQDAGRFDLGELVRLPDE